MKTFKDLKRGDHIRLINTKSPHYHMEHSAWETIETKTRKFKRFRDFTDISGVQCYATVAKYEPEPKDGKYSDLVLWISKAEYPQFIYETFPFKARRLQEKKDYFELVLPGYLRVDFDHDTIILTTEKLRYEIPQ